MSKQPGDPRSNTLDEVPFDPNGYPKHTVVPAQLPPQVPNNTGFIPYRGAEQHGVAIQTTPEYGQKPFKAEQDALDRYHSDVTPRDLANTVPIKVSVVNEPDLIHELKSRQTSFNLMGSEAGRVIQIAQYNQLRTRLRVEACCWGGEAWEYMEGFVSSNSQPSSLDGFAVNVTGRVGQVRVFETTSTDAFYLTVASVGGETPIWLSIWQEYWHYNGEKLI